MPDGCEIYRALLDTFKYSSIPTPGNAPIIEEGTLQIFVDGAIEHPECVTAFYSPAWGQTCEQIYAPNEIQNSETVAYSVAPDGTDLTVYRRCYIIVPNSGGTINVGHAYLATFQVVPAPPDETDCICDCECGCSES